MVNPVVFLALGLAAVAYSKYKHRNKGTNPSEEYNSLKTPEDQWFTQYLDHYDVTNDNTWKQVRDCSRVVLIPVSGCHLNH